MEEDREMEQMQTEQMDPVEIEGREQEEGRGISLVDTHPVIILINLIYHSESVSLMSLSVTIIVVSVHVTLSPIFTPP